MSYQLNLILKSAETVVQICPKELMFTCIERDHGHTF